MNSEGRQIILPRMKALASPFGDGREELVIVAGGRPPEIQWLKDFLPGRALWCADSGVLPCLEAGIRPSRLLGDGDSTPSPLWKSLADEGTIVETFPVHKDFTDLQLALFRAGEEGWKKVIVSGCWGGRFDHLWSAIQSALWAAEKDVRVLAFADHLETLFLLRGGEEWEIEIIPPEETLLSLIPLGEKCEGVCLTGTKWPLDDANLLPGRPFAISNLALKNKKPRISLKKGILGVYLWTGDEGS